ncbi:MAG: hypothetical protein ACR2L6_00025 [Gemmatimonadaceae bacterium]
MIEARHREYGYWRRLLAWFGAGVAAVPLTILTHELGHFLAGRAFNHPRVALHYASVSSDAAKAGYPPWQLATVAAAGPLVTIVTVLLCCYLATRYRPRPLIIALGLFAPVKFSVGLVFIYYWLTGVRNSTPNFDEFNVAKHAGISPLVPSLIGAAVLLGGWFWLVRSIPGVERARALTALILAMVASLALYAGFVGPLLLP